MLKNSTSKTIVYNISSLQPLAFVFSTNTLMEAIKLHKEATFFFKKWIVARDCGNRL